jgi:hypothetical protein
VAKKLVGDSAYSRTFGLQERSSQSDPSSTTDAILGNAGTIVAFRLGLPDAEIIGKEFYPEIPVEDLISLPNYHIYLKLMIDGRVSRPFSAETLPVS